MSDSIDSTAFIPLSAPFVLVLLLTGLAAVPARAVIAYSFDHQLYAIDLVTGHHEGLGEVGSEYVVAAAPSGTGEIFLIGTLHISQPAAHPLSRFDIDARTTTFIATVASSEPRIFDLATDGAGTLWLAAPGGLYAVDLASGLDAFVGPTSQQVHSLAWHQGELYGLAVDAVGATRLVIVDPITAELTPLRLLEISEPGAIMDFDLEFDGSGAIWILSVNFSPLSAPPPPVRIVWRLGDPVTGRLEEFFRYDFLPGPLLGSMAILPAPTPGTSVVEVPVLDRTVVFILTLLLAATGMMATRRLRA